MGGTTNCALRDTNWDALLNILIGSFILHLQSQYYGPAIEVREI
jgi:hypothetical protein